MSQLWEHLKYPEKVAPADSVILMKLIFDEFFLQSPSSLGRSYDKLLAYSSPCILPQKHYLTVLLHVGIVEADIQHHGKVLPVIACLGFKNSNKGSWFVPIDPERLEGNLIGESATRIGFLRKDEKWTWSYDSNVDCIPEREALDCFIKALEDEKEASQAGGVVILTPRYDVSLALLISALENHRLLHSFLSVVDGLGDMEMLAVQNNIQFKSSGLRAYQEYYNHHLTGVLPPLDFSRAQDVATGVYRVLERMLSGPPNYENLHRIYMKPVKSPYVNKLLYNSQILEIREDYHRISLIDRVSLRPGGYEILSLEAKTASKTDIGQEYFVFGYGKLKFGWSKSKLAPNLHLVLPVQNMTASVITLEPGQNVGLAHRENNFNFPTSLYRKKFEQKYFPGKKEEEKPGLGKDDVARFKREISRDISKTEDLKVYDKSKLAESLPFGDIIEKYNKLKEDLKKATASSEDLVSSEGPGVGGSEKMSRRDPRLQKLKEKQEKTFLSQPAPVLLNTRLATEPVKKPVAPPPLINLDLSKDKICKETLQQVDEEMKAIAVTVFPSAPSNIDQDKGVSPKTAFYKKNLDISNKDQSVQSGPEVKSKEIHNPSRDKINPENVTGPRIQAKTKTIPQSKEIAGSCFDFLSECKPKEKSFKYLSKREELNRKPVAKAKERCDKVPDSTKDMIKDDIFPPRPTQINEGDKRPFIKIVRNDEEGRKKHSKKSLTKGEDTMSSASRSSSSGISVQKKKKRKKEKIRADETREDRHERTPEKEKKSSKLKPRPLLPDTAAADQSRTEASALKCKLCHEEFSLRKIFRKHFQTAHMFKCRNCPLKFNSEEKLETHRNNNHRKHLEVKDEVVEDEVVKDELVEEVDDVLSSGINFCSLCGDSFRTSRELTDHISSPHIAPCFDCDLMFVDFKSLLNHKQSHGTTVSKLADTVPLPTSATDEVGSEPTWKRKKVKVEALSEMAVILDVADLIKIDSSLIQRTKDFPASNSGDGRQQSMAEKENRRIKGSEEHQCKSCDKVFISEKDLFHHSVLEHFENWSYTEADRNKKRSQTGLNIDIEPEGPFLCNLCGEIFKGWGSLLKHLWAPHFFKCEYCGKSFNRNTKLEDHVNKEHDFVGLIDTTKCGLCGETFGRSSSLARHINSPHKFQCPRCPLKFPIKSALTRHKKSCTRNKIQDILEECINHITSESRQKFKCDI